MFNNIEVQQVTNHKHLGLILDSKLDFNENKDIHINKCNKIIGTMKILSSALSKKSLLTKYKLFVRPSLDYAEIIYVKHFN